MADPLSTPVAAPVNTALFAKPGESVDQYETRMGGTSAGTGTGFGTPTPALPVTDLATAHDEVAKQLGFNGYQDAITKLQAPTKSETDLYNAAYSAAGLDALQTKINARQNDLNTATGTINDNPWLDESSRVGRVRNLTTLANGDIKNWENEYKTKLQAVHDLVTRETADQTNLSTTNKNKLALLESQAKELAAQAATQAKTQAAKPPTIKGATGATYQWNPTTQTFDQIIPGKNTGNPNSTKPFAFSSKQLTALQSQGLDSTSANGILQDIQAGHDLQSIRQQMKANGLNPGLLDNLMYYVDPKNNTPSK